MEYAGKCQRPVNCIATGLRNETYVRHLTIKWLQALEHHIVTFSIITGRIDLQLQDLFPDREPQRPLSALAVVALFFFNENCTELE